jgi:hypothetical protein
LEGEEERSGAGPVMISCFGYMLRIEPQPPMSTRENPR